MFSSSIIKPSLLTLILTQISYNQSYPKLHKIPIHSFKNTKHMMQMNNNSPFYRTPWSIPSQPKKKVVSIPVHFVGLGSDSNSERTMNNSNNNSAMKIQTRKNNSAIKIQKVVRGFLVRNSMRRIKAIRVELEKIEEKVCDLETKELIKREQKERVKVSESIMNLLLKLDSVRVLNYYSGVRDYRKSVIKKAIALQELVDQIQMVGPTHQNQPQFTQAQGEDSDERRDSHLVESEKDTEEKKMEGLRDDDDDEKMEVEEKDKEKEKENGSRLVGSGEDEDGEGKKMEGYRDDDEEKMEVEEKDKEKEKENGSRLVGSGEDEDGEGKKMEGFRDDDEEKMEVEEKDKEKEKENGSRLVGSGEDKDGEGKKMEGLRDDDEGKMELEEKDNGEGVGEESVGTSMVEEVEENCLVKEEEEQEEDGCKEGRGEGDYENNKNKELLERMMEDNEKMMGMMAQLFERNEMQTKLLSSLSQRVEQLERAYVCDKLRRKKRRNADTKHKQTH